VDNAVTTSKKPCESSVPGWLKSAKKPWLGMMPMVQVACRCQGIEVLEVPVASRHSHNYMRQACRKIVKGAPQGRDRAPKADPRMFGRTRPKQKTWLRLKAWAL